MRRDERDAIVLWWIGADRADDTLLDRVADGMVRELELPVVRHREAARPGHSFDPARGQHSSTAILRWLVERVPARARKVVALTDVDLFIPVLTFVYGEAQLGGTAAVVSTARLGASEPAQFLPRLVKTCVHEVGHTFGLVHCDGPRCVMRRSTNVGGLDIKAAAFCPDCRVRYRESVAFEEIAS
jgi:archaemetzincin